MHIVLILFLACTLSFSWEFLASSDKIQKKEVIIRTVSPMDTVYEKSNARTHLNSIREAIGLNTLVQNDFLADAAQAHADYLVHNKISSHYEMEGLSGFTGIKPSDRALYANYASSSVSENLSTHTYDAKASIDGLFSAIYHRFGFLSFGIDEIGIGVAQEKRKTSNSAFVYEMANSNLERVCREKSFSGEGKYYYKLCKDISHRVSEKIFKNAQNANKRHNPEIVVYPYDGQDEVPPVFYDEDPDPLPEYEVSGFPISIEFNDYFYKRVKLLSFMLYDENNKEVEDVYFMSQENDPNHHFSALQYALFPLKRLAYDTQYKVEVSYEVNDKVERLNWAFTTQKPLARLHVVYSDEATLHLEKGESHTLYFPPHNAHDVLRHIQFPQDVEIKFLDRNTLELTVANENLNEFYIKSEEKSIHILMK